MNKIYHFLELHVLNGGPFDAQAVLHAGIVPLVIIVSIAEKDNSGRRAGPDVGPHVFPVF
jgi:hypothetical protein